MSGWPDLSSSLLECLRDGLLKTGSTGGKIDLSDRGCDNVRMAGSEWQFAGMS